MNIFFFNIIFFIQFIVNFNFPFFTIIPRSFRSLSTSPSLSLFHFHLYINLQGDAAGEIETYERDVNIQKTRIAKKKSFFVAFIFEKIELESCKILPCHFFPSPPENEVESNVITTSWIYLHITRECLCV